MHETIKIIRIYLLIATPGTNKNTLPDNDEMYVTGNNTSGLLINKTQRPSTAHFIAMTFKYAEMHNIATRAIETPLYIFKKLCFPLICQQDDKAL